MTQTVLVTGGGGVGKTTVSAALGVTAAISGIETLVLTVDPARRLADALGAGDLGHEPAPVEGRPGLSAAMVDATASWEGIVSRHAPPDAAARLLRNPYFRAVADRFPAGQAYAAASRMADYVDGDWELVVVDTPPAGGGIEFFTAPRQIRSLVGGRLLRWITGARLPGRRRLYSFTARPMLRLADSVLGSELLEEVADFLLDLRTTYDGISHRARAIERIFRRSTTLVVTTADPAPLHEATRFFQELPQIAARPETIVFNRVLPLDWARAGAPPDIPHPARDSVSANMTRWAAEARRQQDTQHLFESRFGTAIATLPWVPEAPTSVEALAELIEAGEGLDPTRLGIRPPL